MQARKTASISSKTRWVSVRDFMWALLPKFNYETLLNSLPKFSRTGEDMSFGHTFQYYACDINILDPDYMVEPRHQDRGS
jgi:hypothetical protein